MLTALMPTIIFAEPNWLVITPKEPGLERKTYSTETVRKSVLDYLSALYGRAEPTLQHFIQYHSKHDQRENDLIDKYCLEKTGNPIDPSCNPWLWKESGWKRAPSRVFRQYRKRTPKPWNPIVIKGVNRLPGDEPNRGFLVAARVGENEIEVFHIANPTQLFAGIAQLRKVNGRAVRENH